MDPLSIATGTIAIIGAIHEAAKCIDRLRAIRQAPLEVRLLLEEVADLQEVLNVVHTAQRPPAYAERASQVAPNDGPTGLDRVVARTTAKLRELTCLLEHHSSRADRRAPDFGWVRGKQQANAMRKELKILRLDLATSLAAVTSDTVNRIEDRSQGISDTVNRIEDRSQGISDGVDRLQTTVERLENFIRSNIGRSTTLPECQYQQLVLSSDDGSLSWTFQYSSLQEPQEIGFDPAQTAYELSRMTRRPLAAPKSTAASTPERIEKPVQVYAKSSYFACESWCSCACHVKRILRVKQPDSIGSFSVSYSGLPWITATCDQKACRSRSIATIALNVQFPNWLWRRHFSSSLSYASIRGPEYNVRLPRTVSWVSELWRHGVDGNLLAVQGLFSRRLASPWDVQALGGSLLHYATDHAHWDLCKFLVEQGAYLDNEDAFNNSPTSLAWEKVLSGALDAEEESLVTSLFTNTDYLQTRQFSILHKIVLRLIPRTIASELDYSTRDLNATDSSGRTCLSWAAARGDILAIKTLLHHQADVHLRDEQSNTPLHYARNAECVDMLQSAGGNINGRNSFGHTPLHMACRGEGSLPLVKKLVEAGADIDAIDNNGETALSNATYGKHSECALYLIQQGANLDIANGPNGDGDAPIHMVSDVPAVLQLLLTRGAEYTRTNGYNRTILHCAASLVSAETIQILTTHGLKGIDTEIKDVDGKTARDLVEEREDDDETGSDVKLRFYCLLDKIAAAKKPGDPVTVANDMHKLAERWTQAMGSLKEGTVTEVIDITVEKETNELAGMEIYEQEHDDHGPVIFYDAPEEAIPPPNPIGVAA